MDRRSGPFEETIRDPLPGLRKQLASEYEGVLPPEQIDQMAKRALADLDGARIREFVPVFAYRRARRLLRRVT